MSDQVRQLERDIRQAERRLEYLRGVRQRWQIAAAAARKAESDVAVAPAAAG